MAAEMTARMAVEAVLPGTGAGPPFRLAVAGGAPYKELISVPISASYLSSIGYLSKSVARCHAYLGYRGAKQPLGPILLDKDARCYI
jgi:hypothetical protein